jgi:hypothetical protein
VCAQNGHLIPSKLRNYFERASQNAREMKVLPSPKVLRAISSIPPSHPTLFLLNRLSIFAKNKDDEKNRKIKSHYLLAAKRSNKESLLRGSGNKIRHVYSYLHWLLKKVAAHKVTAEAVEWLPHRIDSEILANFERGLEEEK